MTRWVWGGSTRGIVRTTGCGLGERKVGRDWVGGWSGGLCRWCVGGYGVRVSRIAGTVSVVGPGGVIVDGLESDGGTVACYDGESWGTGGRLRRGSIS